MLFDIIAHPVDVRVVRDDRLRQQPVARFQRVKAVADRASGVFPSSSNCFLSADS
jgi:hypothetical protein